MNRRLWITTFVLFGVFLLLFSVWRYQQLNAVAKKITYHTVISDKKGIIQANNGLKITIKKVITQKNEGLYTYLAHVTMTNHSNTPILIKDDKLFLEYQYSTSPYNLEDTHTKKELWKMTLMPERSKQLNVYLPLPPIWRYKQEEKIYLTYLLLNDKSQSVTAYQTLLK